MIILLLFSLSLGTWARTTPGPSQPPDHMRHQDQEGDQRTCFLLEDSNAKKISVIYTKDDKRLYIREGRALPDCSSVAGSVELDTCIVCEREEQVRAACLLTDPSAELDFEARGKSVPLNKKKIQCETAPAPAPAAGPASGLRPAPGPGLGPGPDAAEGLGVGVVVPGPDSAEGLGVGVTVLIVVAVVLGAAAVGFGVFILAKKMWSKYQKVSQSEKATPASTCCTCLTH